MHSSISHLQNLEPSASPPVLTAVTLLFTNTPSIPYMNTVMLMIDSDASLQGQGSMTPFGQAAIQGARGAHRA